MIETAASTPESETEDFRTLWSISAEDIRFFKLQQYSVTNYALALYVALGTASIAVPTLKGRIATAVVGVLTVATLLQLASLQNALRKSRQMGALGRNQLSARMKTMIDNIRSAPRNEERWTQPGDVVFVLMVVVTLAGVVAGWLLRN